MVLAEGLRFDLTEIAPMELWESWDYFGWQALQDLEGGSWPPWHRQDSSPAVDFDHVKHHRYSALKHPQGQTPIRLIRLLPSPDFDAPLRCTFRGTTVYHEVRHEPPAPYTALSYKWGREKF